MKKITIPLFPLDGVIFFPNSQLPLNIFEKRYIEMVDFSLANNRLIGMIQSKKNGGVYEIGCVGKITSFYETDDGRYVINLSGEKKYSINEKLSSSKKFILANVELLENTKQINTAAQSNLNKDLIVSKYKIFVKNMNIKVDFDLIDKVDSESLIKFIAMSSPFSITEKQMLLETHNITELSEKVLGLFDFYSILKPSETIN